MKSKIVLKKLDESVFFEYKSENNSVKKTLEEYIKKYRQLNTGLVDLTNVTLRYDNLFGIDLHDVDLSGSNLYFTLLSCADFSNSNLSNVNLSHANLNLACLANANLCSANLNFTNLEKADLSNANLIGAHLSFTHLSQVEGLKYATCSFTGHGECGRQLSAVKIDNKIELFCGCFKGNESELRKYIKEGEEKYKSSRLFALDTVLKLIEKK